jgi:hypothetical protein
MQKQSKCGDANAARDCRFVAINAARSDDYIRDFRVLAILGDNLFLLGLSKAVSLTPQMWDSSTGQDSVKSRPCGLSQFVYTENELTSTKRRRQAYFKTASRRLRVATTEFMSASAKDFSPVPAAR